MKKIAIAFGIWGLILGYMIIPNQWQLMSSDTTVILKTRPVDPRDLLRGDYVILRYDISSVAALNELDGSYLNPKEEQDFYVWLKKDSEGVGTAHQVTTDLPPAGTLFIRGKTKGKLSNSWWWGGGNAEFGIEKYFVPEGKGRVLEQARNAENLTVEVSLSKKGKALIKKIYVKGEPVDFS